MRHLILLSLFFVCTKVKSQEFKIDISYKYLQSFQLDKAIQYYNFSRPTFTEAQPLFIHGLNSSVSYVFKSSKNLKHGFNVSYSYFRSYADNENFINSLNLHFLNLGYILHYENQEKLKGLYTDLIISATSSGLFRNLNDEPFIYDESESKAFGIGADVNVKLGYLKMNSKSFLSPFIAIAYTPYFFSPNNEAVINQTKGLASKNWTGILSAQVGLSFYLKKNK